MSATETTGLRRWCREDVILLLSSLNFHIYEIQQELLEEEKHGMGFATELLSDCLPKGCTPARVGRKLHSLWDRKGAEGSKLVDIYRHGAYPRTLPFLDPTMLQEIATAVKDMQKSSPGNKNESRALLGDDNIRRSERRALKNINDHPIECRCTFSHYASSCIHCDGCATWQHIFCYYGNDIEDPETHLCDQCTQADTATSWRGGSISKSAQEDFVRSMERLDIHFDDVDERVAKKITAYFDDDKIEGRTSNFDLPRDDEEPWGLEDSEILRVVQLIAYQIGRLADSTPVDHFSISALSSKFLDTKEELRKLLKAVLGDDIGKKSKSLFTKKMDSKALRASLLRALISTAVQQWVFYSPTSNIPSVKTVSFDAQQKVILAKYGFRTLRNIHRATWASLMFENPEQIKPVMTSDAEDLSRRFLNTLEPLIIPADESKNTSAINDWINSTRDGQSRHLVISQIFAASLKLKARLPLTEQYYELLSPALGTPFSRDLMAVEGEDVVDMDIADDSIIQFCIMPGIIEYPMSVFTSKMEGVGALFGPHNFVKATAIEQEKGRVICPAIVTLK